VTHSCATCDAHLFDEVDKKMHYFAHWCLDARQELGDSNLCPPTPPWCPRNVDVNAAVDELIALPTPTINPPKRRRGK